MRYLEVTLCLNAELPFNLAARHEHETVRARAHDESPAVQAINATGGVPVQFHLNNKTVDQTVYNVTHSLVGTSFVNGDNYYVTVEASNTAGSTNVTATQTTVSLLLQFASFEDLPSHHTTNELARLLCNLNTPSHTPPLVARATQGQKPMCTLRVIPCRMLHHDDLAHGVVGLAGRHSLQAAVQIESCHL